MGNRAAIILTDGIEYSPTIYIHWNGGKVAEYIREAFDANRLRAGEVRYSCARLIGVIHESMEGNLSLGVSENGWTYLAEHSTKGWQPSEFEIKREAEYMDNGLYIFNVDTGELLQYCEDYKKPTRTQVITIEELEASPDSLIAYKRAERMAGR